MEENAVNKASGSRVHPAGEISAAEALRQACRSLQDVCAHVKSTFTDATARKREELAEALALENATEIAANAEAPS